MAAILTGVVKSFGAQKGFGFIASEFVAGGDVYFQRSDLPGDVQGSIDLGLLQLQGRAVAFELRLTQDGKPQAKAVQLMPVEGEPVIGEIKSFSDKNGFGFLKSSSFPDDIYFHRREVPPMLNASNILGTKVLFVVHPMPDGKNQARQMNWGNPLLDMMGAKGKGFVPPGAKGKGKGCGKGFMPSAPMMSLGMVGMSGGGKGGLVGMMGGGKGGKGGAMPMGFGPRDGAQMVGLVKMFNSEKGFGFISTPGAPGDIYFKAEEGVVSKDQQVSFVLRWSQQGQPQAHNLCLTFCAGESLVGTVKSYNEGKGYGFVTVPERSQDVFFQTKDLPADLEATGMSPEGASVSFTVRLSKDGRPQMQDAELLSHPPEPVPMQVLGLKRPAGGDVEATSVPAKRQRIGADVSATFDLWGEAEVAPAVAAAVEGTRAVGRVKSYNALKGFGFIECPSIGGDVYFQRIALPMPLQQLDIAGHQVSFDLKYTPDGKPQGAGVQVSG